MTGFALAEGAHQTGSVCSLNIVVQGTVGSLISQLNSSILWYSIRFISDVVIRNCTAISRSETLLTELLRRISQIWLSVVYKSHHHHHHQLVMRYHDDGDEG